MNLRWTDAGRAALASAAHVGTAAVRLTHFAIGDGSGPGEKADDNRTDLRNERHRAAIAGTPATRGRIALRADFAPDASYSITEAGIFGTAGDPPGAPQLLLYWAGDGAPAAAAASGTDLAIAAVIEFQNAVAGVAVTVGDKIVFGVTEPASEAEFGSTRYATAEETGLGEARDRSVTPSGLHSAAGEVVAALLDGAPGDGTIYQLKGTDDGSLIVEERAQDGASAAGIASNAAAITGLGNRLTAVEGKLLAPLVPAAGAVDKTYVIQRASGANGGGLKIVEAVFRRYVTPGSHNLTVPAGVTRLRVTLVGAGGGGGGGATCGEEDAGPNDNVPEGTSEFAGCTSGSAGSAGGLSAVRRAGSTIASAAGGARGRGGRSGSAWVRSGGAPAAGAVGKGGGGDGGLGAVDQIATSNSFRYVALPGEGGDAGAVKAVDIDVTPGEVLEIVCGAGGAGGRGGPELGSWDAVYPGGPGSVGGHGMVQIVNA